MYVKDMPDVQPLGYRYDHFVCKRHFPLKRHLHMWTDVFRRHKYYPDYNRNYTIEQLEKGDFDILHPTYFDDYFLPYLKGKPFVLTVHDMIPELFPQYFRRDDFQIVQKRKLAPLASAIVAVSENTKKDVVRLLKVPEEKVHVIYHGCSFPSTGEGTSVPDFPYVLFVGARGEYKNFVPFTTNMVSVLNRHKNLHIVCTGWPFSSEEQKLFETLGIQSRMIHRWVNDDSEMFALYHHAVCFVYPSEYEGFGIPILEAYKAGCPVMLNRASCFPEIAGDAAVYFKMSRNHSDFAEQLEMVLSMGTTEKETLLAKQRKRLARYSWEKSAMQLAQLYSSMPQT